MEQESRGEGAFENNNQGGLSRKWSNDHQTRIAKPTATPIANH